MINVTIGQYYPAPSIIHRLDPRTKLFATLMVITLLLLVNNFIGYGFVILCVAAIIKISQVPPKYMFKGLKGIIFLLMFTVILNIFFAPGQTVIFSFGFISITLEGLILASQLALRLIILVVFSSILTLTTSPIQLTGAIEYSLNPYKKIGVPAHEIAMMMTIALRFIPTLMEELDKIIKAQKARGADFETGNIVARAKSLVPVLVPLFISAFRRADDLAIAMESRCYRGDENRTRMKELKFMRRDYVAFVILFLFAIAVLSTRFL